MKKNNGVTRKPVVRKAIILTGEKFQTIASNNQNYEPCIIMGVYSSIEEARSNYINDMKQLKLNGGGAQHYAIRKVDPEPAEA